MKEEIVKELLEKNELSWIEFSEWMFGQTIQVDENDNILYFPRDVNRYIRMKVDGIPTYFD